LRPTDIEVLSHLLEEKLVPFMSSDSKRGKHSGDRVVSVKSDGL